MAGSASRWLRGRVLDVGVLATFVALSACGGAAAPTPSTSSVPASAPASAAQSKPQVTPASSGASAKPAGSAVAAKPAASGAATPAGAPAGSAQHGQEVFAKDGCYECHDYQGQGGTGTGPKLAPNPLPFVAFQAQVRTPRQDMPKYPVQFLPDQDLADIYAYLQSVPAAANASSLPLLTNR